MHAIAASSSSVDHTYPITLKSDATTSNRRPSSNRRMSDATSPEADSIVAYRVDQSTGTLTLIGHATEGIATPRGFGIDPSGRWLYACNQEGDTIVQFAIDQTTGALTPTGHVVASPTPVCLIFRSA